MASQRKRSTRHTPATCIVEAILEDHRDLKQLIPTLKSDELDPEAKVATVEAFMALLKSHAASEEQALYEPCRRTREFVGESEEGFVEHQLAASLMDAISRAGSRGERTGGKSRARWAAQVKVLAELVEHHIEEEEEEFLPRVERRFDTDARRRMATAFLALRARSQCQAPGRKGAWGALGGPTFAGGSRAEAH